MQWAPVGPAAGDLTGDMLAALTAAEKVAVDTETGGLDWSRDRLHLCQLYSPDTGAVVIRRGSTRPRRLSGLLSDDRVTKIFHFAPFDLRFLESAWDVTVANIRCTKAASKLLDPAAPSSQHSLAALLDRQLGVTITKGAVRTSNWAAPVLSDEQLAYAASDVSRLLDLYDVLLEQLRTADLETIYRAVCTYMPVDSHLAVSGVPDPLHY